LDLIPNDFLILKMASHSIKDFIEWLAILILQLILLNEPDNLKR